MDKKTFYDELSAKLRELGVRNDYIDKHINQFENYFADKSSEQVEAEIARLGDIDRVASRIKRMTDKMLLADTGIPEGERHEDPAEKTGETGETENEPDLPPETDIAAEEIRQIRSLKKGRDRSQAADDLFDDGDESIKPAVSANDGPDKDRRLTSRVKKTSFDDKDIKKKLTVFRILSILCIPLVLLILLATAAVFAVIFLIIALLVIFAVAVLALVTVAGTCIFAFGFILGVVKLLENLPVGLYECGLSLMIGSAALFVGILIYNFAVRLMPFAASKLLQFMKFVFRKYRVLYAYIKKEVLRL